MGFRRSSYRSDKTKVCSWLRTQLNKRQSAPLDEMSTARPFAIPSNETKAKMARSPAVLTIGPQAVRPGRLAPGSDRLPDGFRGGWPTGHGLYFSFPLLDRKSTRLN